MTIVFLIAVFSAFAFVGGILVGRKNPQKVNAVVDEAIKISTKV